MPHAEPRLGRALLIGWPIAAVGLLCAKAWWLDEALFWDAVGCYLPQARMIAEHGLDWSAYQQVGFLRPPVYNAMTALLLHLGATRLWLHVATCVLSALALPACFAIARRLGASRGYALMAALLCALSPLFFAQAHLVQTDAALTALVAVAWAALLYRRLVAFALLSALAVWTKESAYYLCLPAALLLLLRARRVGRGSLSPARLPALIADLWPAAVPGLALCGWLLVNRALIGRFIHPDHADAVGGWATFGSALLHAFVEGGRLALVAAAALAVGPALRRRGATADERTHEIVCTALAVALLPLCFPAPLPRYMLPTLPLLCALAVLGVARLAPRVRVAVMIALPALLISGWFGDSFHENPAFHLESNLEYRAVLALHVEAAQRVAAERPRAVLAEFPMYNLLGAPPVAGYLEAPLPRVSVSHRVPEAQLCDYDLLVATPGDDGAAVRERLAARGALTLLQHLVADPPVGERPLTPPWARFSHRVDIYKVSCGAATAGASPPGG